MQHLAPTAPEPAPGPGLGPGPAHKHAHTQRPIVYRVISGVLLTSEAPAVEAAV